MMLPRVDRFKDVVMFFRGDDITVVPSPEMLLNGWSGGQGVMWSPGRPGELTVTYSDGRFGGFLLYGSDEVVDQLTVNQGASRYYRVAVMFSGMSIITTSCYEKYTWASRQGPGPLVPITYKANDLLYFSLRGYWTTEDEATLAGKPHAPNFFSGFVTQTPKECTRFFLGVQTSL